MQKHRLFLFNQASGAGLFATEVGERIATFVTAFDVEGRKRALGGFEELFGLEARLQMDRIGFACVVTEVALDTEHRIEVYE